MIKIKYAFLLLISLSYFLGCTIGVGRDSDGSAVLWKNRDRISTDISNIIYVNPVDSLYGYSKIVIDGYSSTYMGFNDHGFGVANSVVQRDVDLNCSSINSRLIINDESLLIEEALKICSDVDCFQNIVDSLESTYNNINFCDSLSISDCQGSDICYWSNGSEDCDDGCFAEHIQSNFVVIDNNGDGAVFEVDTFNDIYATESLEETEYIFRSNHFKILENPSDYSYLDIYDCSDLTDFKSNARRWCSSDSYFESLGLQDSSIIKYLIESDPNLNNNKGPLLRSLSRSNHQDSDIFYDLSNSYYYQNSYCEGGDPAGYIYSNYSIARHKTTSSVVMKSIPGNLNDSFILTALGNPLFSPYVPIKIADFEQVNSQDFLQISQDSQSLFDYFFDWNEGFVDSHHLIPSNLSDYQSHDGAFSDLKNNIESQYVDFLDGILISDFNSSLELISGFYEDFLEGFVNEGYDAPQYKVNAHNLSVESCEEDIFPSYKARRIIDQTFHRNHSGSYVFKVEQSSNSANSFIVPVLDGNVNPIITQDHWSLIPSQSDVDVYLIDSASNQILASFLDKPIGCTNDTYIEYDLSNRIDDGSCGNLGDINTDGALDVLDVVEIMNLVLEGEYYHIADINNDGFVNVLDILQIVNFILS